MSRVDDLVAVHCPNGVAYHQLSDVAQTVAGLSGKTKSDFSGGNARYISYMNAFTNLAVDQSASDYVVIGPAERQNQLREGDVVLTGSSESLDEVGMSSVVISEPVEPLYLNSFCFALRFTDTNLILPEFSKYLFRSDSVRKRIRAAANGVTRINLSKAKLLKAEIPVPPIEVQREIVRVLDQFTQLEAELEAELEARRYQYKYYRNLLLSFPEGGVGRVPMGELGEFTRGNGMQKKDLLDAGIPAIHYGQIHTYYGTWTRQTKSFVESAFAQKCRAARPGDLVIATTSEDDDAVGKAVAWLGSEDAAISGDAHIYRHSLDPKYVAYFFQTDDFHRQKARRITGVKVRRVSGASLAKILIPVPSLDDQEQVVATLDKFDAMTNDLSVGLPGELAVRRKQYEYYRDKLLTFKELPA